MMTRVRMYELRIFRMQLTNAHIAALCGVSSCGTEVAFAWI